MKKTLTFQMICPSCGHEDTPDTGACQGCGFSLAHLHALLGSRQVTAEPLIDHASCLSIVDNQAARALLDAFERRFPQVAITTFLGDLPAGVNPAMAGVWLLNQARLERLGQVRECRFGVAVIVNPVAGQAGIAVGYALEAVITPELTATLLSRASPLLWHREHAKAIALIVAGIDKALRSGGKARRRFFGGLGVGRHLGLQPVELARREASLPP